MSISLIACSNQDVSNTKKQVQVIVKDQDQFVIFDQNITTNHNTLFDVLTNISELDIENKDNVIVAIDTLAQNDYYVWAFNVNKHPHLETADLIDINDGDLIEIYLEAR
jgi:hypothetical protein